MSMTRRHMNKKKRHRGVTWHLVNKKKRHMSVTQAQHLCDEASHECAEAQHMEATVNLDHTLQDIGQILEKILSHVNFHIFSAKENFFYNHYALDARYDLELELDAYSAQRTPQTLHQTF